MTEASKGLRAEALSRTASDIGVTANPEHPNVFGILMETGYPEAVATLAVFAEGSTSMYFSSGGGIIGAGEHESVRETHAPFFAEAEAQLGAFTPATSTPLPSPGRVRFYVRTFKGTLTAEAGEEDLGEMRHSLSELFHAGHAVIAAVREVSGDS
ncbi:MAG: hypothetical protein ACREMI_12205 [Gemmatimonadales bacterium]